MLSDFYASPPSYDSLQNAIRLLRDEYSALKVFPIGKSVLEREISALCLGNPGGAVLFVGATHGLEWLTCTLLMRFCQRLLYAQKTGGRLSEIDVSRALSHRSLVVIPCLNPDGVEIALRGEEGAGTQAKLVNSLTDDPSHHWQANANGVDLNHNFDAGWKIAKCMEQEHGVCAPAPTRYGGEHPHSEPETVAVTTFCVACRPRALYSFHSQGEEIYWHYGRHTPQRSRMMAQILASSSGYELSKPAEMASHAGLKDWFIEKLRRPGFTIEVGRGKNPLGLGHLDKIYDKIEEMLMIATLL